MAFEKCIYCRVEENLTIDHVPPKLFLMGPPYPENIVKVPACRSCNQSFQKDDEYIRTLLVTDSRAIKNASAQSNLPAVLRSLERPDAKGFVAYLASQAIPSTILKADGLPMAQVFELDKVRANRAGERFIRAFYFSEVGTPLPAKAKIKVGCRMDLRHTDGDAITIARVMQTIPDWREKIIGTAFNYLAAIGPGVSFWLMNLYEFFFWAGTVDYRDEIADKP